MNDIIDCITSLKDLAVLGLMWFGASGLIWLHDIVKAKRELEENVQAMASAAEQSTD